jgi:prephenate dehydrogenase
MNARRALIHGTGLVGASLGLALRSAGWDVSGWDPDRSALEAALARGAVTAAVEDADAGTGDADLLVLAGPPGAVIERLGSLETEALVTDVAGVKAPIVGGAGHLPHFVGGHPMAGGATAGPAMASSHLFHGATWVLTTDHAAEADLASMEQVVRSVGANPVRLTAEEHDTAVAVISHVPHLLAAALVRSAAGDPTALSLAGGGFRDLTRVAGSETGWWTEVLTSNSESILVALAGLEDELSRWKALLTSEDSAGLSGALESARVTRGSLGEHHAQVRVVLFDRPGEIATVGHALEESGADVRDFQLRHGEHGGGGVLTISVSPRTVESLRGALEEHGFTVEG